MKWLIDGLGASLGAIVGTVVDSLGGGPPAVIASSAATALVIIVVMRRMIGSMTEAGRETIDGLRAENERLRKRLEDKDGEA